jgi:Tfp pilus assembly protein PilF
MKILKTIMLIFFSFFSLITFSQNKKEDVKQAEIFYNKAINNFENNLLKEALTNIDKSIKLNPNNSDSYYIKGVIKQEQLDFNGALTSYKKAIQLNQKHSDALAKCGIVYGKLNDKVNACKYFKLACESGNSESCKVYSKFCK